MGSRQETVDYIVDQIAAAGAVSAKKMFGEYGIYCDGKMAALVCDDQLFVKPTAGGRAYLGTPDEASPYPGAKPCFLIDGGRWDDAAWLAELLRITTRELPVPKKKAK
jgi:TfoX/Sxy family transcriptional regulator of competence genes